MKKKKVEYKLATQLILRGMKEEKKFHPPYLVDKKKFNILCTKKRKCFFDILEALLYVGDDNSYGYKEGYDYNFVYGFSATVYLKVLMKTFVDFLEEKGIKDEFVDHVSRYMKTKGIAYKEDKPLQFLVDCRRYYEFLSLYDYNLRTRPYTHLKEEWVKRWKDTTAYLGVNLYV
jgi:hypothetical protein